MIAKFFSYLLKDLILGGIAKVARWWNTKRQGALEQREKDLRKANERARKARANKERNIRLPRRTLIDRMRDYHK